MILPRNLSKNVVDLDVETLTKVLDEWTEVLFCDGRKGYAI